ASQPRRSWPAGSHDANEARIGTGPPGTRRASKSNSSRTINIVLPAPGPPRTTSRPVGTRASTCTSSLPVPASSLGLAAQVLPGGAAGHPAPLLASATSASQLSVIEASIGSQETGNG